MNGPLILVLPYPISANRYWATRIVTSKATHKPMALTYVTPEAVAYKQQVGWLAKQAGVRAPFDGRVAIEVQLYASRPQDWARRARKDPLTWDDDVRSIDLDNANKVLLDAFKGVVIVDDSRKYVRRLAGEQMEPDGEARVVVTITPLVVASPQAELLGAEA